MSGRGRYGGTVSVVGVHGGMTDPMPMTVFDKQIQLRMGQANVRRSVDDDDIVPLLADDDPLDVDTFATHHLPLTEAPDAYPMLQKKADGAIQADFDP
jgi:threonine dehydrogenase-like Zn-dependent dehydrogenase